MNPEDIAKVRRVEVPFDDQTKNSIFLAILLETEL